MAQYSSFDKFFGSQSYEVQKILDQFRKPIFENIFFQNLDVLKENSDKVKMSNNSWHMRPEKFCLDYYGEPYIFPVLLMVNDISSIFNFRLDKIPTGELLVPKMTTISRIIGYIQD